MTIARKVGIGYVLAVVLTAFLVWTVQHSGEVKPVTATVVSSERWGKYGACDDDSYCKHEYWKTTVRSGEVQNAINLGDRPADGSSVTAYLVTNEGREVIREHDPTRPAGTVLPTLFIGMVEGLLALFLILILEDRQYSRRSRHYPY